jgi:hypothetical protein
MAGVVMGAKSKPTYGDLLSIMHCALEVVKEDGECTDDTIFGGCDVRVSVHKRLCGANSGKNESVFTTDVFGYIGKWIAHKLELSMLDFMLDPV